MRCLFFFFKQKTAYEMLRSLVGSEMCIRDSSTSVYAQTISDNVVINEVDTNPFGDDSMTVAEWLSLIHI